MVLPISSPQSHPNLASFELTNTIKVKLDAMKPWIHEKLTEILGFEDDVVIDYAKRGCVFSMVIWPAFRMGQHRASDHPYHAP